jgi:hypothetical protein
MIDPDVLIEQINKAGLGLAVVKRFVEKHGNDDDLTEGQVTALLMGAWGREFGKRFQAQDAEGLIARQAVAKARDAAWLKPMATLTGERALAAASQARGERADPPRERIIRDKAVGSPFLSQEQLEAYAGRHGCGARAHGARKAGSRAPGHTRARLNIAERRLRSRRFLLVGAGRGQAASVPRSCRNNRRRSDA